jgi:hypothetical protein
MIEMMRNCGVALQVGRDLQAVADRQVEVEQDQAGPERVGVGSLHELDRLLAVADHIELDRRQRLLEGLPDRDHVVGVVLDGKTTVRC